MVKKLEEAAFAAGCFWGMEETFRCLDGVKETEAGYMGGTTKNPTYEQVSTGKTGHAETVHVKFDPKEITYQELLDVFWKTHDPTTSNRQGLDIGTNYRSVIFYYNEKQRKIAMNSKDYLDKSGRFKDPIVTEIIPATDFWRAEEHHQKYLMKKGLKVC